MDQALGVLYLIVVLAGVLAGAWGWSQNIVRLFGMAIENRPVDAKFVMRLAGVAIPLVGIIMGYVEN